MSMNYVLSYEQIIQKFEQFGLLENEQYELNKIGGVIDKLVNGSYDRNILEQLFEQCKYNYKNQVLLQDFCQVVIEAERVLKRKISKTEQQLEELKQEHQECIKQHEDAQCTIQSTILNHQDQQQLNTLGIEKDSILTIALLQAHQFKEYLDYQSVYVVISVGNYQNESQKSNGSDRQNPIFNQHFQLQLIYIEMICSFIQSGEEHILFGLIGIDRQHQQNVIGKGILELNDLHDQKIHLLEISLQGTDATLKVEAQWIYNKIHYFQELNANYDQGIKSLTQDIDDFYIDLGIIQKPFLTAELQSHMKDHPEQQMILFAPELNERLSTKLKTTPSKELKAGLYFFIMFTILSTVQLCHRTSYLNVIKIFNFIEQLIVGLLLLLIVFNDQFYPQFISLTTMIIGFSIVIDILWIILFSTWMELSMIHQFIYILSFFLLIIKPLLLFFIYHFFKASKDKTEYLVFTFYEHHFLIGKNRSKTFSD